MRIVLLVSICLISSFSFCQSSFQLAPPILIYKSAFIDGQTTVSILFDQPGATVHYSIDGSEPTATSPRYSVPIVIKKMRTVFKARSIGKGYLPSDVATVSFIGGGKQIKQISFTPPHESYSKVPVTILHDNKGGIAQYGSGSWLGYNADTVEINITLKKKEIVGKILVDLLQDENSWIFLPEQIDVYYMNSSEQYVLSSSMTSAGSTQPEKHCVAQELKLKKRVTTDRLKIVFRTVKKIPDWHPGKGQHGWFFIDEIKVY